MEFLGQKAAPFLVSWVNSIVFSTVAAPNSYDFSKILSYADPLWLSKKQKQKQKQKTDDKSKVGVSFYIYYGTIFFFLDHT